MMMTTPTTLEDRAHEFQYLTPEKMEDEEEPFDCLPEDDSESAILKRLSQVVQASDKVLQGSPNKKTPNASPSKDMMTPVRSHTRASQQEQQKGIQQQTIQQKRYKVSLKGKQRKPKQEPIKFFVNQSKPEYEPPASVIASTANAEEELPFDETPAHRFKAAFKACVSPITDATTPDTSLEEDEWSLDTDYYTQGTGATGTTGGDETYEEGEEEELYDEAQMRVQARSVAADEERASAKKKRNQERKERQAAAEEAEEKKKPKEAEAGLDEWCLDMVFSPDVTESALEVADFIQKGAEITSSKAKDVLKQGIEHLEQEEAELESDDDAESDEKEQPTDASESSAPQEEEADAAAGAVAEEEEAYRALPRELKSDEPRDDASTSPTVDDAPKDDASSTPAKKTKGPKFTDLLAKGLPLGYRKVQRIVKLATEQATAATASNEDKQEGGVANGESAAVEEAKEGLEPSPSAATSNGEEEETDVPAADENTREIAGEAAVIGGAVVSATISEEEVNDEGKEEPRAEEDSPPERAEAPEAVEESPVSPAEEDETAQDEDHEVESTSADSLESATPGRDDAPAVIEEELKEEEQVAEDDSSLTAIATVDAVEQEDSLEMEEEEDDDDPVSVVEDDDGVAIEVGQPKILQSHPWDNVIERMEPQESGEQGAQEQESSVDSAESIAAEEDEEVVDAAVDEMLPLQMAM